MKILIKKQIHSCFSSVSTGDVFLKKEIDIPFAPFVGLRIQSGDIEEQILEVYWDAKDRIIKCYVEEDKELYNEQLHNRGSIFAEKNIPRLNEIVDAYVKMGWEIDE